MEAYLLLSVFTVDLYTPDLEEPSRTTWAHRALRHVYWCNQGYRCVEARRYNAKPIDIARNILTRSPTFARARFYLALHARFIVSVVGIDELIYFAFSGFVNLRNLRNKPSLYDLMIQWTKYLKLLKPDDLEQYFFYKSWFFFENIRY